VVLARTVASAAVVCRRGPGAYYYRGVRLKDGAGIALDDAQPAAGGFDVVNPADGTLYQIRSTALTIFASDGEVFSEPMIQYAAG
jgi:serine/threonine-protein kinase